MKVAFLDSENKDLFLNNCSDFIDEYKLLKPYMKELGADLELVNWRKLKLNHNKYDIILPKRCWDYNSHYLEFIDLLYYLKRNNIKIVNNVDLILWNTHKKYLLDLKNNSLNVGDILILNKGNYNYLSLIENFLINLHYNNREKIFIAKPAIGLGGSHVFKFTLNDLVSKESLFNEILVKGDLVIQTFFPEIEQEGEFSFFFFNQKFSHALQKKPAKNSFLAHQIYGAKNLSYSPLIEEIDKAKKFISTINPNYVRVDIVKRNGEFYLVELELIEPYLYLNENMNENIFEFCKSILN